MQSDPVPQRVSPRRSIVALIAAVVVSLVVSNLPFTTSWAVDFPTPPVIEAGDTWDFPRSPTMLPDGTITPCQVAGGSSDRYAAVGNSCAVLDQWENEAITEIAAFRGITGGPAIVRAAAGAEVEAVLWMRLLKAIESTNRTADEQTVVDFFTTSMARSNRDVAQAGRGHLRKYRDLTNVNRGSGPCNWTPPAPYESDFPGPAGARWSGCTSTGNVFNTGPPIMDQSYWLKWGSASAVSFDLTSGAQLSSALAGIAAGGAAAGVAAGGLATIAATVTPLAITSIFPLANGLGALSTAAGAGVTWGAILPGFLVSAASVIAIAAIFAAVAVQLILGVFGGDIADQNLTNAMASAMSNPPDLRAQLNDPQGRLGLFTLFNRYVQSVGVVAPARTTADATFSLADGSKVAVLELAEYDGGTVTVEQRAGAFVMNSSVIGEDLLSYFRFIDPSGNKRIARKIFKDDSWQFQVLDTDTSETCAGASITTNTGTTTLQISCPIQSTIQAKRPNGSIVTFGFGAAPTTELELLTLRTTPTESVRELAVTPMRFAVNGEIAEARQITWTVKRLPQQFEAVDPCLVPSSFNPDLIIDGNRRKTPECYVAGTAANATGQGTFQVIFPNSGVWKVEMSGRDVFGAPIATTANVVVDASAGAVRIYPQCPVGVDNDECSQLRANEFGTIVVRGEFIDAVHDAHTLTATTNTGATYTVFSPCTNPAFLVIGGGDPDPPYCPTGFLAFESLANNQRRYFIWTLPVGDGPGTSPAVTVTAIDLGSAGPGNPGAAPLTITNVAPTVTLDPITSTPARGTLMTVTGRVTDPSADDAPVITALRTEGGAVSSVPLLVPAGPGMWTFSSDIVPVPNSATGTVTVTARDKDGGEHTATRSFTTTAVGGAAPTIAFNPFGGPRYFRQGSLSMNLTFGFSPAGVSGQALRWWLDSTSGTPLGSRGPGFGLSAQITVSTAVLAEGPHTLYVELVDSAGRSSGFQAFPFVIDTIPPTVVGNEDRFLFVQDGNGQGVPALPTWSATDTVDTNVQIFCQEFLDDIFYVGPQMYWGVGQHSYFCNAADDAGNRRSWTTDIKVGDRDAVPVVSDVTVTQQGSSLAVSGLALPGEMVNDTRIAKVQFWVDTASGDGTTASTITEMPQPEPWTFSGSVDLAGLADGDHRLLVRATDEFGRVSSVVSVPFAVAPVVASIPAAPTDLLASAESGTVALAWVDNSSDESGFSIERARWNGREWVEWTSYQTTEGVTSFSQVVPDGTYAYVVAAYNTAGSSASVISTVASSTVTAAPSAPTGLTLVSTPLGVRATWTDESPDELGFEIMRARLVAGAWTEWTSFVADRNVTSFDDPEVADGVYSYLVRAYNSLGFSDWLIGTVTQSSATAPPSAPSDVAVVTVLAEATVSWTENSPDETHFDIARARYNPTTQQWGEWAYFAADRDATTFTDSGVADGQYVYAVRSVNPVGVSAWSYSGVALVSDPSTPPAAPGNLRITAQAGTAQLEWDDLADNEVVYEVQRAHFDGVDWTGWTSWVLDKDTTSFVDADPRAGVVAYLVRATNGVGSSDWAIVVHDPSVA